MTLHLFDGGIDVLEETGEVAHLDMVAGTFDGTAGLMSEDHDDFNGGDCGCEFHRAELVAVLDVTSYAADEDITEALVEHLLDRHSRIDA